MAGSCRFFGVKIHRIRSINGPVPKKRKRIAKIIRQLQEGWGYPLPAPAAPLPAIISHFGKPPQPALSVMPPPVTSPRKAPGNAPIANHRLEIGPS